MIRSRHVALALMAGLFALACLGGCAMPGRVEITVPIGKSGIVAFAGVRSVSLWEWEDAPRALSLSDFKEVQR